MLKTLLSATALTLAASGATAATVDLVTDGGFESGTSANFSSDFTEVSTNTGANQYLITTGLNGVSPNSGSYFMLLNGGSDVNVDPTVWSQSVNVTNGTEYTLSFSMADWSGFPPDGNLSIRLGGTEILNATSSAATDTWENFSKTWTSTLSGHFNLSFVEFSTATIGNDYALDDIAFTYEDTTGPSPIPLPASLPMLLAGLGTFGLLRRRRD